jgi:hypothetical protein
VDLGGAAQTYLDHAKVSHAPFRNPKPDVLTMHSSADTTNRDATSIGLCCTGLCTHRARRDAGRPSDR